MLGCANALGCAVAMAEMFAPVVLEGQNVRLEPLGFDHEADLCEAARDPEIWTYMSFANCSAPEQLRAWLERVVFGSEQVLGLSFAVILPESGKAIGSTSLYDWSAKDLHLEIGRTWYGRLYQRTFVNTECKYLLLRHAFEGLGCHRVQLKTDVRNLRSQQAIERLGAQREGVLRAHMVMPDGFVRDTVMYSVIASEWPVVKMRLEGLMGTPRR